MGLSSACWKRFGPLGGVSGGVLADEACGAWAVVAGSVVLESCGVVFTVGVLVWVA